MKNVFMEKAEGMQILDSRGNPTVSAKVTLSDGVSATAAVPSGASTGKYEACELRDGRKGKFGGLGVEKAVGNINLLSRATSGLSPYNQYNIDRAMLIADGSDNKSNLGANALLAVSLAAARAASISLGIELYEHIGGMNARRLPYPMMNILNGGAHAGNNIDIQEFMIVPVRFPSFSEALRAGSEIYTELKQLLKRRGFSVGVGDEGGFAPDLKDEREALDMICTAIENAGYEGKVSLALDAAASEWADDDGYKQPKSGRTFDRETLCDYWKKLASAYPIISIEDGMGEDDDEGWRMLTDELGDEIMLVGDDLFVTNKHRIADGIAAKEANSVLIKPNQIGTLTETLEAVETARQGSYKYILSHRSGETEDNTLADIAVGCGAPFIKTGAPCRSERLAKYNRLLEIEKNLGKAAIFGAL